MWPLIVPTFTRETEFITNSIDRFSSNYMKCWPSTLPIFLLRFFNAQVNCCIFRMRYNSWNYIHHSSCIQSVAVVNFSRQVGLSCHWPLSKSLWVGESWEAMSKQVPSVLPWAGDGKLEVYICEINKIMVTAWCWRLDMKVAKKVWSLWGRWGDLDSFSMACWMRNGSEIKAVCLEVESYNFNDIQHNRQWCNKVFSWNPKVNESYFFFCPTVYMYQDCYNHIPNHIWTEPVS